jgi:hypothetical protein
MPNNNPGNNSLGWSVNSGGNSGGVGRGIMGAALNALGQARRTQQRLYEFDYKENAKRESYIQRKAADQAGHVMKSKTNEQNALKVARIHKDKQNFNYNGANGSISYSQPSTYTEDMLKLAAINQQTEQLKNDRANARDTDAADGNKKDRSTKTAKTAKDAKTATDDGWAATAPSTPTPSRTTSNITPPTQTTPKPRKPRAPRVPKNPGQPGGTQ